MTEIDIVCRDGIRLGGHWWAAAGDTVSGTVIVNPATGVVARYYHRYARFLAGHGYDVLTYDYRGIGVSRPARLKGCGYRWADWGERDFDAALRFVQERRRGGPLLAVGHSIGGFLPGLAESAWLVDRLLTVGAQHAWWLDYAPGRRAGLFLKWHVAMPVMTALCGYFPGRRLGWLEDLPAGVANDWSFGGPNNPKAERFTNITAPILAVAVSDDELGTVPAIRRTLSYYINAPRAAALIEPADYGRAAIGHFNLFHDSHEAGFWTDTLTWLRDGRNPWRDLPL
jgi:predicted alpha/beta hydrolase